MKRQYCIKTTDRMLWAIAVVSLLLGNGCATMNASECQTADWEMIGFEDGSKGRLVSYLGNHRKACAAHGITPDLTRYLKGHSRGVEQFCTETSGFLNGKKGIAYNGVCPPELSDTFLRGYHIGEQFYAVSSAINRLESSLQSDRNRLEQMERKIRDREDALIHKGTTEKERRHLLKQIKANQREIRRLERKIGRTRRDIDVKEYEYDQLEVDYATFLK